jgi:hypothetical protein
MFKQLVRKRTLLNLLLETSDDKVLADVTDLDILVENEWLLQNAVCYSLKSRAIRFGWKVWIFVRE